MIKIVGKKILPKYMTLFFLAVSIQQFFLAMSRIYVKHYLSIYTQRHGRQKICENEIRSKTVRLSELYKSNVF